MIELKFDTEGITSCPDKGTATIEECLECRYCKPFELPWDTEISCIYENVFPEPSEELNETLPRL